MRPRILLALSITASLAAPPAAQAAFAHVVAPGESLSSIAADDGMSVSRLAGANGLAADAQLVAGSTIQIPPQVGGATQAGTSASTGSAGGTSSAGEGNGDDGGSSTAADGTPTTAGPGASSGGYVVQPGDTLSAIAAAAGLGVAELAAANGIDANAPLLSGTALTLSGAPGTTRSGSSQPVGSAAEGSSGSPPYPTPERVTSSQVEQVASANGVSGSLAAAIGWQESGFNNDLVSSADARGVMQILPGTWDWIQRTLTGGTPLASASAIDNVRGGVLLLHSLLASTGGDPALTAAGYYQGLSSVRKYGVLPSTQRYVNAVMALRQQFGGP
jgi:LysM repeat protein